jgi:hypothetical protein
MQPTFGSVLATLSFTLLAGTGCGSDEDGKPSGDGESGKGGTSEGGSSGATSKGGSGGTSGSSAGKGGSGGTAAVGGTGGSGATGGTGGTAGTGTGKSTAADVARKLGRAPNFLVGMGNDLNNDHSQDGAYTLGVTMDMHYAYLVGLPGEGGWPDWNAGGTFVNILTDSADAKGTTPMFTVYGMAAHGEANAAVLADPAYMGPYWAQQRLLFERLAEFDKPAIVHLEPDFWAFQQQQSGGDPASVRVLIHDHVEGCDDQPENLVGLGHCIVQLSRTIAPKVVIGFHASRWGGAASGIVSFLNAVGAGDADFVAIDMLDRDAGCFEAHTDPACQRQDGPWYWDETNQSSPNFHEFLDYSKQISDGVGRPIIWWQIPFGVPSATMGGTAEHYRDNRVHYLFGHIDEFVAAGGLGAAFGTGAGNQTYITTDGGQFRDAVTAYYANPVPLP